MIEKLEKVQKRATKLVRECRNLKYKERLKYLDLSTLRLRRSRGDMIEVYKILNNFYCANSAPSLIKKSNLLNTRGHIHKLEKPYSRLDIKKFFFTTRVINTWNKLPASVIEAKDIFQFKSLLDAHWMDHPTRFCWRNEI